jgi:hypothetical protein
MPDVRPRLRAIPRACWLAALCAGLSLLGPRTQGAATTPNPGLRYYYPAPDAPRVDVAADVVVYGGTPGGVVAAVQAVRLGKRVALVAFGRHVGGMTAGGLTATDGVDATVQGGITREYFNRTGSAGFKPSKAEQVFEEFLADPIPGASYDDPVPTYYEQRLASVEKVGPRIVALHMENGSVFRGRVFLDCTYEGDLLARAGVGYAYGREATTAYGESRAGRRASVRLSYVNAFVESGNPASGLIYNLIDEPQGAVGMGDSHVQAYNFRMYTVQSADPAASQPLHPPAAYDASAFEILYRFHRGGGSTAMSVGNDINNHELFDRGCATDHIGGNRWPDGQGGWTPWADANYATRELIYQSHVAWQLGMLWYIATDARYAALTDDLAVAAPIRANVQALIAKVRQLGFPLGEYPETGGWPHELYVREARRMVSDFVVTQAYCDRVLVAPDAVGLANYSTDSHHVRRIPATDGGVLIDGDTGGSSATPWRIPKRSQCDNLLVPWALSASHVAFCSTRMEPCLMVLSQSAATAAALADDRDEAVQDIPYELLKLHLLADRQILGGEPTPEPVGLIVDNADTTGFSTQGTWLASSATTGYYGSNYLHDGSATPKGQHVARFVPVVPSNGTYQVFLRWTSNANRSSIVPVDIVHADGTNTTSVNQQLDGGQWNPIGTFAFGTNGTSAVIVRNDGANGYVIADAVKFVPTVDASAASAAVHVVAADATADEETATPGRFQIVRVAASNAPALDVQLAVGGSAVPGKHVVALPSQVTIPAGAPSVDVFVTPVVDWSAEGTHTVVLDVLPGAAYAVGDHSSATVWVEDASSPPFENLPYARATEPSDIGATGATLNGGLVATGSAPTTVWVVWDIVDHPEASDASAWPRAFCVGQRPLGPISQTVEGLLDRSGYVCRWYAENADGARWSEPVSFRTRGGTVVHDGFAASAVPDAGQYRSGAWPADSLIGQSPAVDGFAAIAPWASSSQFASTVYFQIVSEGLAYTNLLTTPGALRFFRDAAGIGKQAVRVADSTVASRTWWVSFLLQYSGPGAWFKVLPDGGAGLPPSIGITSDGRGFFTGSGNEGTSALTTTPLATGAPHLYLVRFVERNGTFTADVDVWIDPPLTPSEAGLPTPALGRLVSRYSDDEATGEPNAGLDVLQPFADLTLLSSDFTAPAAFVFDEFTVVTEYASIPRDAAPFAGTLLLLR